jgi:hypothetical protein
MKFSMIAFAALAAAPTTVAEVFLKEQFNDEVSSSNWS